MRVKTIRNMCRALQRECERVFNERDAKFFRRLAANASRVKRDYFPDRMKCCPGRYKFRIGDLAIVMCGEDAGRVGVVKSRLNMDTYKLIVIQYPEDLTKPYEVTHAFKQDMLGTA